MTDIKHEVKMPTGYEKVKVAAHEVMLYESHAEIKLPNGMMKAVSLGDFIAILSKVMVEETSMKTLLLPAGCYVYGQSLTEIKLACYYPGKPRDIEFIYKNDTSRAPLKLKIPFPNVIVSHKLKRKTDHWMHEDARYFGTSRSVTELENKFYWEKNQAEQIWVLPLGNIFPEARLCQGGNTIPKGPYKESFRGLDWHFAVLYSSSFNNDLTVPSLAKGGEYCENWYKELSKYKIFPYELLVGGKKSTKVHISMEQEILTDTTDWLTADLQRQQQTNETAQPNTNGRR